ncbi:CaiB/BaiF CoA transferase family protein [Roseitalea porphyridii]|uniref:CoA transferase n=1 Tax=Roseitalea porphyridii TaxID=1852022 RepID=A0A4P6UZ17_9HYPH|nr:CaiB/BaiF CoA-transferase family protein [Roseitalea porphyridii]QBK30015.1 CoA transferase [Roseitalea porphyridii]
MNAEPSADRPLAGIRVIELARVLAGPWAGQMLADLGADVIKVEHPDGGDETRGWGPPFITGADGNPLSAAYFHAANRGKRSVAVDFKTPEGQATVRRLAATADVVIENFKVGGLAKHGLDHASLSALNRRLVTCSITGFGQTGPYRDRPGYDFIIQGMAGFMSVTGEPDRQPMKAGVAIADIFSGVYAVAAIEAALIGALKTGRGRHIDIALMDVMLAAMANQNMNFLATGTPPNRLGNAHPNIAPYQVIETADGFVIIAVGNDGQFARLCGMLGLDDLPAVPRFATNRTRVENRAALTGLLAGKTRRWRRDDLVAACEKANVPTGPINTIADAFADPQIIARGMRVDLPDAAGNPIASVRMPVMMDGLPLCADRPSPRLGEHTDEVLAELEAIETA